MTTDPTPDADVIVGVLRDACAAVERGDVEGLMRMFHEIPGTFLFDYMPPRSGDTDHLRTSFRASLDGLVGTLTCEVLEVETHLLGADAAFTAAVMHVAGDYRNGDRVDITYRATDVWRRIDGRWAVVHEHASVPVDPVTGRADLTSSP